MYLTFLDVFFMYTNALSTCMYVYHKHAWYPQRSEDGAVSPGTGVTNGCELPRGFWEVNPGPLQEQPEILTAQPSLQPAVFLQEPA